MGAAQANGNVGPFATFIRTYTERQALLRGVNISGKMQIASNEVARNAISAILNVQSTNYGILPTTTFSDALEAFIYKASRA